MARSRPSRSSAPWPPEGRGHHQPSGAARHDITIGDRTYKKGERVPTGLDVPKGGAFIIGIKTFYDQGHLRMGITCALCHAAVDAGSGKVVEGAPNTDLNAGLLMALAKNSSAYFMHASVPEADAKGGEAVCPMRRRWRRRPRCRSQAGRPAASIPPQTG